VPSTFTAVFDACVLYPFPLRNLLMELALTDLFRARWTDDIHKEWIRSVLATNPNIPEEKLFKTRDLMNAHVRDALVTGYESLIPSLSLPDENDRHVLAAAIRCQANTIVTFNLKDFPPEALAPWDIEAQHPDEFVANLIDLHPVPTFLAVDRVRQRLKNPPMDFETYLEMLFNQQLSQSVAMLRSLRYPDRF
jgi:predicted nucleic acid-binding protein